MVLKTKSSLMIEVGGVADGGRPAVADQDALDVADDDVVLDLGRQGRCCRS